jgi:glycosyltransferase involved in cell wall biosynthesis
MTISRVLIAEPIYHALVPLVYGNRIKFWKNVFIGEYVAEQLVAEFGVVSNTVVSYDVNSLIMGPRRNIRSARATAIKMAREKKASHVLFIDDDILVPEDILERLLRVDKDIVGGLMHRDDGMPIVFTKPPEGWLHWEDHPKDRPFQCGGVGAGCMLIKTSVFDKIDKLSVGLQCRIWYFTYDQGPASMDLLFCRTAIRAGCEVWCLPDPPCQQLSHY